jgi:hypothetical protein
MWTRLKDAARARRKFSEEFKAAAVGLVLDECKRPMPPPMYQIEGKQCCTAAAAASR